MTVEKAAPRAQTPGEERANSLSHGISALLSAFGCAYLVVRAASRGDAMGVTAAALYGASLVLLFSASSLYHALPVGRAKRTMQVLDHCSIFLLIWGTYVPISLSLFRGALGWTLFGVIGGCAVLGIVLNAVNLQRWKRLSLALYLIMGWAVALTIWPMLSRIPAKSLHFLLGGGAAYTLGVLFYRDKRRPYAHFLWHLCVLAGAALHYGFILLYCY